jgi:APA family basic amino acid/polyamine antiporter
VAIWVQAGVAIVLLLVLRRSSVLDFTTFAIVLATIADTLALYTLRRRRPDMPRPYRAWGYPWVPAIYLVANALVALALMRGAPLESLGCLVVIASGVPFYAVFARRTRDPDGARASRRAPAPRPAHQPRPERASQRAGCATEAERSP